MAEILVQFDGTVQDDERHAYRARACGRAADDGLWEGWLEFEPADGGPVLETAQETKQPNRADLEYWAGGLTSTYLEGALQRALQPDLPDLRPRTVDAHPTYDAPAPTSAAPGRETAAHSIPMHAVLDPYEVYAQGEDVLRDELSALDVDHLRSIAHAHSLLPEDDVDVAAMDRATLAERIVAAARRGRSM